MKILFVCSANKHRSKTAEAYFSKSIPDMEFDSAGTNHTVCDKEGTVKLEEKHLEWADKVVVMEAHHQNLINRHTKFRYQDKISALHIPDEYEYMDSELIATLEEKMETIVGLF